MASSRGHDALSQRISGSSSAAVLLVNACWCCVTQSAATDLKLETLRVETVSVFSSLICEYQIILFTNFEQLSN